MENKTIPTWFLLILFFFLISVFGYLIISERSICFKDGFSVSYSGKPCGWYPSFETQKVSNEPNKDLKNIASGMAELLTVYVWMERNKSKAEIMPYLKNAISKFENTTNVGAVNLLMEIRDQYDQVSKGERQRKLDSAINEILARINNSD